MTSSPLRKVLLHCFNNWTLCTAPPRVLFNCDAQELELDRSKITSTKFQVSSKYLSQRLFNDENIIFSKIDFKTQRKFEPLKIVLKLHRFSQEPLHAKMV